MGRREVSVQSEKKATAKEMKTEFSEAEQDCRMISLNCNGERKAKANRAETKRFSPKQVVKDLTYIREGNSEKNP